ncbi:MAG: baseplate J/gp47 family protein [Lachnospiraceae bacterium]|nr:baseplate J/gp47 family protein [Lachnospiraceae bacterium]
MLRIENTLSRTYEERMADNYTTLPLISSEWTNYNPSDPGITILENLTAFEALQGSRINSLSYRAKIMLLAMAGFKPVKGKSSRLLLACETDAGSGTFPANQRFLLGDMVYETRRAVDHCTHRLKGIFSYYDGSFHNYSYLCDREYNIHAKVFGEKPKVGDSIYFIADSLPEAGQEALFYITLDSRFNRNAVEDRAGNIFAGLKWECYTEEGFKEIKVKDYTGAFLVSGELKLRMPNEKSAVYDEAPEKGYCIKATLTRANYDIRPGFTAVDAFLFEVWQRDTRSLSLTFQKSNKLNILSPIANEGYILVFGKEKKGSSYKRYELAVDGEVKGRFCLYKPGENGYFSLEFDRKKFGYEPEKLKDAIKVVIYSEEIMRRYRVGSVIGYDDQEIELPVKHIVTESFSLIAKRKDENGEDIFDFVRPEKDGEDALYYHLLEDDGRIIIEDAGDFIGAELFMAGVAVFEGEKGNIRAGNYFRAEGLDSSLRFYNPGPGVGGCYSEVLSDVKNRFREDVYTPYTCVTAEDYERAAASTPGLCIRKVRARMDEMENLVHISVMPGTDEEHPSLSDTYKEAIFDMLTKRRLVTTRFQILAPIYVGVAVRSTVYVKRHYRDCREEIETCFKEKLDYTKADKNFGEPLKFEDVFRAVEELDCVEYIYELSLRPENPKKASLKDTDIYPEENCLLYPGQIDLEIVTYDK